MSSPEFTPIGSKSTNLEPTNSISNISPLRFQQQQQQQQQRGYRTNGHHHYPLHRRKEKDDIDLLQSSSVASSVWDDDVLHEDKSVPNGKFSRLFGKTTSADDETEMNHTKYGVLDTEINDDGNMIKEQSELVKKLQSENTNLKIEVLTLRRHMTGIPTDSMELIEQNVLLNQEVMKLKELLGDRPSNTEELYDVHRELSSLNEKYTDILHEKDRLLRESFEKDSDLEKLKDQCAKYESEVFELKMELDELKQKQLSHHDDEEIGRLEDDKLQLQRELEQLSKDYDDLEQENEQLKENVNTLQTQLDDVERDSDDEDLQQLRNSVEELRKEKEKQTKEHDAELRAKYLQYREKIDDMTQQLREATKSLDDSDKELFEKEKEIDGLRREVKKLSSELDTLARKNGLLEKQLQEAGSESEATKMLSNEVESLYKKIEEYEKHIHELTEELNKTEEELEYAKDFERENRELEENVARLEEELKRKDIEVGNAHDAGEEDEEGESSYIDGILQLKDKFEEEREAHREEVERIVSESEQVQANLVAQIEELEATKEQLVSDYDALRYDYEVLVTKTNEVDVDELGQDLAKISLEYKKTLDERETLVEMYEKEVAFLKSELRKGEEAKSRERVNNVNVESLYEKLDSLEKTVKELRDRRSELEKKVGELGDEKVKLVSENEGLKKYVKRWEETRVALIAVEGERDKLKNELEVLKMGEAEVLIKSSEVRNRVEMNEVSKQALIREYELKLAAKDEQYNTVVKEFNFMKDDLISRLKQMKNAVDSRNGINASVGFEWKSKYEEVLRKLRLVEREAEELRRELRANEVAAWAPPTPETPSRTNNNDIPVCKYELLKVQKELLMLKYSEKSEKLSDLKFLVKYYTLENEYYNSIIESNRRILGMSRCDKERNSTILNPVSKLRSYFLVALATVRMKKRIEEVSERAVKSKILKGRIEVLKGSIL